MALEPEKNIKGISSFLRESDLKRDRKEFPYQGLWLFTGTQGSGKTLLMMHLVAQMHQEFPDAIIVSNISIFGLPCVPFKGIEDFEKYKNGEQGVIFIIDEIHTLWSSLQSARMPESTLTVWSQNRKNRRVILGTSQRFSRVAKGIREQTLYNYECTRPLLCFFRYRVIDADLYDDQGKYIGQKPPIWSIYVPRVNVMRMYNTLEVVLPQDKEALGNG